MSCPIQRSFTLDCKDSKGGIKQVYLAVFPSNGLSYSPTVASGVITAWSSASSKFFTYEVRTGIASGTDNATITKANGTKFYAPTLNLQLEKLSAASSQELDQVIANRLLVIYLDRNGKYFLMGYKNGMDCTAFSSETGVSMGDFSGYKMTLAGEEENPQLEISSGVIAALLA